MTVKSIRGAIFLDRDGTISPDEFGYINNPDHYHLYPQTIQALKILQDLGYLLLVLTNQSGIARGYVSIEALYSVHAKMEALLVEAGVKLDGIYYAPYHQDGVVEPYVIRHYTRKPGTGMIEEAKRDFQIDMQRSFMIGDRYTDIGLAKNAGIKSILVLTGDGKATFERVRKAYKSLKPDFVCENILTAAQLIQKHF